MRYMSEETEAVVKKRTPEERIMLAVLSQAIKDLSPSMSELFHYRNNARQKELEIRVGSIMWFTGEIDSDFGFSCKQICEHFGISRDDILNSLFGKGAAKLPAIDLVERAANAKHCFSQGNKGKAGLYWRVE